jgi:metal-responsive CopG/Arc/MetJ family transcriptional regulator
MYFLHQLSEETNMAKINLIISDKLEKEFREAIFKKYGMKRGNLSKAVEEAIKEWIEKQVPPPAKKEPKSRK